MREKIKRYAALNGIEEVQVYMALFPAMLLLLTLIAVTVVSQNLLIPIGVVLGGVLVYIVVQAAIAVTHSVGTLIEVLTLAMIREEI